jgi:hypothetical protein
VLAEALPPTDIQAPAPPRAIRPESFVRLQIVMSTAVTVFWIAFGLYWLPGAYHLTWTVTIVVVAVVALLLVLTGVWAVRVFGRLVRQQITKLTVSDQDLRAVRVDGSVLEARWDEPTLRVVLRNFRPADAQARPALELSVRGVHAVGTVTREGATLVEGQASRHGLVVKTWTNGKPPREWTAVEIRPKT